MTSSEFLSYLRSLDFKLWLEGDNLRYSAPTGVLTPNLREQLAENKNEIVIFLRKAMAAVDSISPPLLPGSTRRRVTALVCATTIVVCRPVIS